MTIEHTLITDPFLHEPKNVSSALSNTVYVANGAGTGSWSKVPAQGINGISSNGSVNQLLASNADGSFSFVNSTAHGGVYFVNIGAPNVVTYPSVYTKINPTTNSSGASPIEFTEGTNARLTYTGTRSRHAVIQASVSLAQSSGADRDVRIAIYKNGALLVSSESIITAVSGSKRSLSTIVDTPVATNDYFEAYVKNDGASGDVSVYTFKMHIRGFLS